MPSDNIVLPFAVSLLGREMCQLTPIKLSEGRGSVLARELEIQITGNCGGDSYGFGAAAISTVVIPNVFAAPQASNRGTLS